MANTTNYESKKCDLCCGTCTDEYIDGKTSVNGLWGNMCVDCFRRYGVGLGTGKGQRYEKHEQQNGQLVWREVDDNERRPDSRRTSG